MPRERRKLSDDLTREALPVIRRYLTTGSTLLDLAIADRWPGGVGLGRVTQFYGDSSTGKSVLAQTVLAAAQQAEGLAVYEDAEATLDMDRAENVFGLDCAGWEDLGIQDDLREKDFADCININPRFVYRIPKSLEQLWDGDVGGIVKLCMEGTIKGPVAMAVDTFSAIPSEAELKAGMADNTYGMSRAKQMSAAFRKYMYPMAVTGLTIIAVDQVRDKTNISFGDKDAVSGGRAMEFYASTRVRMRHAGYVKGKSDDPIGVTVECLVKKNKCGPPFRKVPVRIIFDFGVDDLGANLEWLEEKKHPRLTKAGSWTTWQSSMVGQEYKAQGTDALANKIEDADAEADVRDAVVAYWKELHEPIRRRKK